MKNINFKTISALVATFIISFTFIISILLLVNFKNTNTESVDYIDTATQLFNNSGVDNRDFDEPYKNAKNVIHFVAINNDSFLGLGTAWYYKNNIIITNEHNLICEKIEDNSNCHYVITNPNTGKPLKVDLIAYNQRIDIAALYIHDSFNFTDATICENELKLGENVWSFGYGQPYHLFGSLKKGYQNTNTKAFFLYENIFNVLNSMIHLNIRSGDSGSPIFKENGCVVGIVNASNSKIDNLTSYINHTNLKAFLDELELHLYLKNQE